MNCSLESTPSCFQKALGFGAAVVFLLSTTAPQVHAQRRAFMVIDCPQLAPTTGSTTISMMPGATVHITAYMEDNSAGGQLFGYQLIWRPAASPQAGATGSVTYVDIDPAGPAGDSIFIDVHPCDPPDADPCLPSQSPCDCGVQTAREDWVFSNQILFQEPFYNEETTDNVFGVFYATIMGFSTNPAGRGILYLAEFDLEASADACGEFDFPFNTCVDIDPITPNCQDLSHTPPFVSFFAPFGAQFVINEFQPLTINVVGCGDLCAGVDCSGLDDQCVVGVCNPDTGDCETMPDNEGAMCDDGDNCTTDDTCCGGECVGTPVANGTSCDDDSACTLDDSCAGGTCTGTAVNCSGEGDQCNTASCNPAGSAGNCDNRTPFANGEPCIDGDACTTIDICEDGSCVGGPAPDCDDANVCTDDSCDPASGCVNEPNSDPCDDGNACTSGDMCAGESCVGGPALDCDDANVCTDDSCNPASGCVNDPNSDPCDDGNACTTGDVCAAGTCTSGPALDCDDANVCTDDSCDPASGCVNDPNSDACDDGNACTSGDMCAGGTCTSVSELDCDDGNVCTDDSCDPASGCVNAPNSDPCAGGGLCQNGQCVPPGCTDPCSDDNPCTTEDMCVGDFCIGTQGDCSAFSDDCNEASCNTGGAADNCDIRTPINNGQPCSTGVCQNGQCVPPGCTDPCSDNNACTSGDMCAGESCVGGPALDCDDANVCTDDSCDPASSCVNDPNSDPCDDGNACTTGDMCAGGTCISGTELDCDDTNVCTDDSCDPASGCVNDPNSDACDDGNACTSGDMCAGGTCTSVSELDCDDGNVCTDDSCDPASGCVNAPNSDPCAGGGLCQNGQCIPPGCTDPCSDDNPCTTEDMCVGDFCIGTQGDCSAFSDDCNEASCNTGGAADNCDIRTPINNGQPCSTGVCQNGQCVPPGCTDPCSDNNACTMDDMCAGESCVGGPALDCDDANVCTDDSCDPASGCVNDPNSDPCAGGGLCQNGQCVPPGCTEPCDDGDACTVDDACFEDACIGVPVNCTEDDCSEASCNPDGQEGNCETLTAINEGLSCNDGEGTCQDGVCVIIVQPSDCTRTMIIKGGACPAPISPNSNGFLQVVLVGDADFDVSKIDLTSLNLRRCDGVSRPIFPNDGPPGPGIDFQDSHGPFEGSFGCADGGPCSCPESDDPAKDGMTDLQLRFDRGALSEILPQENGILVLELDGLTNDGDQFCAKACIRIVGSESEERAPSSQRERSESRRRSSAPRRTTAGGR